MQSAFHPGPEVETFECAPRDEKSALVNHLGGGLKLMGRARRASVMGERRTNQTSCPSLCQQ